MPTSLIGAVGLGRQSAKDTPNATPMYFPATSIGLNMNQNVQTLPPEIGGDYFLRGSYKASVNAGGDIAAIIRPNSFGNLLYMLAGQDTVTTLTGNSINYYSHSFVPFTPAAGVELPWFTAYKDIGKLSAEQYLNTKLRSLSVDVPKQSIATCQSSLLATTPSAVTVASLGTETFDSSPSFQTCSATVTIAPEAGSTSITFPTKIERFSLQYANNLSEDEYSVGNYYMDGISLLQRTVSVSMDMVVRDTSTFYNATYLNGGGVPSAWSPVVYRGALAVTLTSTTNIGNTGVPYSCVFTFPGLDFMMMPINGQGAELIRATLSTQVTLGPSGSDRFSCTLVNGIAAY